MKEPITDHRGNIVGYMEEVKVEKLKTKKVKVEKLKTKKVKVEKLKPIVKKK